MGLPPKNVYNKRFENMSIFYIWFTSTPAGNTACNYRTSVATLLWRKPQNLPWKKPRKQWKTPDMQNV